MWSEEKPITDQKLEWGFSSAGRAPALHAGGQEFESPNLHHLKRAFKGSFLLAVLRSEEYGFGRCEYKL